MLEFFAIAALLQLIEEFSELFVGHVGHTPLGGTPAAPTEGADGKRFCQLHPARSPRRHVVGPAWLPVICDVGSGRWLTHGPPVRENFVRRNPIARGNGSGMPHHR